MRTLGLGALLLISTTSVALAEVGANGDVTRKLEAIQADAAKSRATWNATKAALNNLGRNKQLRAALAAKNQVIVLGEREGAYTHASDVYYKSMHLGMTEFTGSMGVKVRWKEQLVFGPKGLEIRTLQSASKPTPASVEAFRAALDEQFARKPSFIKMPDTRVEYQPFTEMNVVNSNKARVRWLGFGSTRLKPEQWSHLTPAQVKAALHDWATTP